MLDGWRVNAFCPRGHVTAVDVDALLADVDLVCPACAQAEQPHLTWRERRAMRRLRVPDKLPEDW